MCVGRSEAPGAVGLRRPRRPHTRGTELLWHETWHLADEAPPQMWGGAVIRVVHLAHLRVTPTCVGRRGARFLRAGCAGRHPHRRGAEPVLGAHPLSNVESTPRGWGGEWRRASALLRARVTPTGVGWRTKGSHWPPAQTRHPHMRGAESGGASCRCCHPESPPHAWGGGGQSVFPGRAVRDTPTCVGGGLPRRQTNRGRRVTPTLVGQSESGRGLNSSSAEPLPRAWGGGYPPSAQPGEGRVTPTRMGRCRGRCRSVACRSSHPHADGAERGNVRVVITTNESPPRGWGGARVRPPRSVLRRATPTPVGRSTSCEPAGFFLTSHPHAGGAEIQRLADARRYAESPPRGWGGADHDFGGHGGDRGTPTGVGRSWARTATRSIGWSHSHGCGTEPPCPSRIQ
jgi:hypothetical protein